jgi:DMSO/TMAO reductase YedYZ molybdopterin-dependent catalytic subunit
MNRIRCGIFAAVFLAAAGSLADAQTQKPLIVRTGTLEVTGAVKQSVTWKPEELRNMPRTTVSVEEKGETLRYEGVLVGELLKRAGAALGEDMRGPAVATYVVASAADGYRVVFSLGELDPAISRSEIMVADTVDGKPLFDYQGPLRLVVPRDTRGARSVRMLQRLEVVVTSAAPSR